MSADELAQQWLFRVNRMQLAHYDAAVHFERQNLYFGIPVVVLSTVVGTTIFATISKDHSNLESVQIFTGLLSVTAAVLASLQTFLRYGDRAERHRTAGAKYAALKTQLELIALPPKDERAMKDCLEAFAVKWAAVHEESPTVPQSILDRATVKVQSTMRGLTVASEQSLGC